MIGPGSNRTGPVPSQLPLFFRSVTSTCGTPTDPGPGPRVGSKPTMTEINADARTPGIRSEEELLRGEHGDARHGGGDEFEAQVGEDAGVLRPVGG